MEEGEASGEQCGWDLGLGICALKPMLHCSLIVVSTLRALQESQERDTKCA